MPKVASKKALGDPYNIHNLTPANAQKFKAVLEMVIDQYPIAAPIKAPLFTGELLFIEVRTQA